MLMQGRALLLVPYQPAPPQNGHNALGEQLEAGRQDGRHDVEPVRSAAAAHSSMVFAICSGVCIAACLARDHGSGN
jgi:hypothetical protein